MQVLLQLTAVTRPLKEVKLFNTPYTISLLRLKDNQQRVKHWTLKTKNINRICLRHHGVQCSRGGYISAGKAASTQLCTESKTRGRETRQGSTVCTIPSPCLLHTSNLFLTTENHAVKNTKLFRKFNFFVEVSF